MEMRVAPGDNLERSIRYWQGVGGQHNFGDFLTELLADELFLPVAVRARGIHIIGSCLDDIFFAPPTPGGDAALDRLVFWGCGLRTPGGLSEENRKRCTILAVRGPLTRSALRLGDNVPVGDPALLLPAIYQPAAPSTTTAGRSVCVPHILDDRTDAEVLAATQCDVVLRTSLPSSKQAMRQLIDQIVSADFVLAASLHAAIVAAAYGRPFAFWSAGHIDLPFKWADTAALLSIPLEFAADITEGRERYSVARASLRVPSVWPLLASAPLLLKPAAILRVLRFEAASSGRDEAAADLEARLSVLANAQRLVDDLSAQPAGEGDWPARAITQTVTQLERLEASEAELRRVSTLLEAQVRELTARLDDASAEGARLAGEAARTSALAARDRQRVEEAEARAAAERTRAVDREVELQVKLDESSRAARARVAELEDELEERARAERTQVAALEAALEARSAELRSAQAAAAPTSLDRLTAAPRQAMLRLMLAAKSAASPSTLPLRGLRRFARMLQPTHVQARRLLARSRLFDAQWYLTENPDVAAAGLDPVDHYLKHGAGEGRDPSPLFLTGWYLRQNPDVAAAGINPLVHYLVHGWLEGRSPNALFEPRWYLAQYPDVAKAGLEPLSHYVQHGVAEDRKPWAGFDAHEYLREPSNAPAGEPLAHKLLQLRRALQQSGAVATPQPLAPAARAPLPSVAAVAAPMLPRGLRNRSGPRVLFIDSTFPSPDRDSGSVTARYLIDIFVELGWQVSFYADGDPEGTSPYARELANAGVRCLYAREISGLESFLAAEGATFSLCMLFRVHSGGRRYELVRRTCPNAKIVFETVDLHFLREERQARTQNDRRALNLALGVRERELYVARNSDLAIVVSEYERALLEREIPGVRAMTLPLILDCPGRKSGFASRRGICFVGGFLHQPNVDAVEWFLDEIWPLVLERLPSCTFSIVGADMPESFAQRKEANVIPVGYVRDLDAFLDTVRLSVAPLRYGAGVKGKVGSSLANGVPCVGSPVAVEGMGLVVGKEIAVGATPLEFAERIVALHEDEVEWNRMSSAGWSYVAEHYSLDAARRRIAEMLRTLTLPASVTEPGGAATSKSA